MSDATPIVLESDRGAWRRTLDRRFWAMALLGTAGSLLLLGLPTALIPNPVFGRQIAAEPWAYRIWLASARLAGLVFATYAAPTPGAAGARAATAEASGSFASIAGLGVFLAVGCPVCNKAALLLLGTSGALAVFGPLQPAIGMASLVALAATLWWRLRTRGRACEVRPAV